MRKTILSGFILLFCLTAKGQLIDDYGLKTGAGLSNQYWRYQNNMFTGLSGWNDNRIGLIGQVFVEKELGRYLSFRPSIGYIQKGFVDDITLITTEGEELAVKDKNVVFHDLSLDLVLKVIPMDKTFKPYMFFGFRGDYLIDYRSVIIDFQGQDLELNTELYNDFNKLTFGAIIGVGVSCNNLLFLDLEYNPTITKNFDSDLLAIHDQYFSLTLGVNINRLIKRINK